MKLPGNNVLILSAVCISLIASIGAYKLAAYEKSQASLKQGSLVASASSNGNAVNGNYESILQQAELSQIEANAATSSNPFAPAPNDTLTDTLSKTLFTSYLQHQEADQLDNEGQEEISNKVLSNIDTSDIPGPKYSLANIIMFYPKTNDEIKEYGNKTAALKIQYFSKISANPQFYNNNLSALGDVFTQLGEEMMKMKVPSQVALKHLEIANGYITSKELFKIISNQAKDPVKSLLALKVFKENTTKQDQMYTEINAYFKSSGILFTTEDPGFIWVNGAVSN